MRLWWMIAGLVAAVLAVVFATVGDGVHVAVEGWQRPIREVGHWLAWGLLALGLGLAAIKAEWTPLSQALCLAGGLVYLAFVCVVVSAKGRDKHSGTG